MDRKKLRTNMKMVATVIAAITGLAGMQASAAQAYDCKLDSNQDYGWIPPRVVFVVDEPNVQVMDGIIAMVQEGPMAGKLERRDATSIQIEWSVKNIPVSNLRMKEHAVYTAVLNEKTGKVRLRAVLATQYSSYPKGWGKCAIGKE
ncbi:hypothetical protein [Ruegeria pomeroyi]|uniref:hypothetical protein n=1 Tax=Ruegeria pomeroyi TaxID=89184 RepID=UPI0024203BBE|nr:hypothetical protein [Ruegeria pomeroyi]